MGAFGETASELERLLFSCITKRDALFNEAVRRERLARRLSTGSGIAALLSGFIATAVFAELTSSIVVKVLSAVLTFGAGIISLLGSIHARSKDVEAMFNGASEFLVMRDKIRSELLTFENKDRPGAALLILDKYNSKYGKLSKKYDRFLSQLHSPHRVEHYLEKPDQ